MRRTDSRIVRLPRLYRIGQVDVVGLDKEQVGELNVRSYDYGNRSAIPTLEFYIVGPFTDTLKTKAYLKAVEEVGLDEEGIIRDRYSAEETIGGMKFAVTVYPSLRSSYDAILSQFKEFLETVIYDCFGGRRRDGVRRVRDGAYITLEYITDEIRRLTEENTTRFNRNDLAVKYPETDEKYPLDEEIESLHVYLDPQRYSIANPENSDAYQSARSLGSRIRSFMSEYQGGLMEIFGIGSQLLTESQEFDYNLSDGSGVRFLFYPKTSIQHGAIYSNLVGRNTKHITASTGDLDILQELAFRGPYENMRRGYGGIRVETEVTNKGGNQGVLHIRRAGKGGIVEDRKYRMHAYGGATYVNGDDILEVLARLHELHTKASTELKLDFFAASPEYLR